MSIPFATLLHRAFPDSDGHRVVIYPAVGGGGPLFRTATDLLGWLAPRDCLAVGVVAGGRARRLDGSIAEDVLGAIQVACAVAASGEVTGHLVLPNGSVVTEAPSSGCVLDELQRAFQLPTAPPELSADAFATALWLRRVVECGGSGCLSWRDVVRLHPLAPETPELADEAPGDTAEDWLLDRAGQVWCQEQLRLQAAAGACPEVAPADIAAWFDEGSFARWLLGQVPDLASLSRELAPRLTGDAARRVERVVSLTDPRWAWADL